MRLIPGTQAHYLVFSVLAATVGLTTFFLLMGALGVDEMIHMPPVGKWFMFTVCEIGLIAWIYSNRPKKQ